MISTQNKLVFPTNFWCGILLLVCLAPVSGQEHILELLLDKGTSVNTITLTSTSSFPGSVGSDFKHSDIDINASDQIRLQEYGAQENFTYGFLLKKVQGSSLELGFAENGSSNRYVFEFSGQTNNQFRMKSPASNSPFYEYTSDTDFKIVKCNNEFAFYKDQTLIFSSLTSGGNSAFTAILKVTAADAVDAVLHLNEQANCGSSGSGLRYSVVRKTMPNDYIKVTDNMLNFYYLQKYAIVPMVNDLITCQIFDDQHSLMSTQTLPNKYGSNYQTIDVTSLPASNSGEVYFLEVTNANKGEKYHLKFIK